MKDKEKNPKSSDVEVDAKESDDAICEDSKWIKKKPSTDPEDSGNQPKDVF